MQIEKEMELHLIKNEERGILNTAKSMHSLIFVEVMIQIPRIESLTLILSE